MKKHTFTPFIKMTLVVFLFAMLGVQQIAKAQLTVVNNTTCWIVVGEQEGPNCNICTTANGTWIPPINFFPFNQVAFPATCPGGTIVTPFPPPPPGFESWIGIKFGVSSPFGPGPLTSSAFENNPNYIGGPCFLGNLAQCQGQQINPVWVPGINGATTVTLQ